jgi:hypothetical protein
MAPKLPNCYLNKRSEKLENTVNRLYVWNVRAKVKKAAESVRKYDSIIRWQLSNLKNQMVKGQLYSSKAHLDSCLNCSGSGLVAAMSPPIPDTENYPHVAIIGGGIGGVALAVACLHRGFRLPFTNAITASKLDLRAMDSLCNKQAIEGLGVFSLEEGVISTRHLVHTTDGKVIGEWE